MYTPPPRIELPPRPELLESLRNGVLLGLAALVLLLPPAAPGFNGKRGCLPRANRVAESSRRAVERLLEIDGLASQCEALARMEYDFLYDGARHLHNATRCT